MKNLKIQILAYKIIALILLIVFFSLIFFYSYSSKTNWNIKCDKECGKEDVSFTDMVYFCTVTGFTVGYGDISPKDNTLRYLVMLKIFLSSIILIY
jgi:voltage-gated potassium channel